MTGYVALPSALKESVILQSSCRMSDIEMLIDMTWPAKGLKVMCVRVL